MSLDDSSLSIPFDKCVDAHPRHSKLARESFAKGGRPPVLWSAKPVLYGQYPKGFVEWAATVMCCQSHGIVHVCSGLVKGGALRIDINASRNPDVVADGRKLPLQDRCAAAVMLDPPYAEQYAQSLYQTEYPRPSQLLREASRIAMPNAPIGFLHVLVPNPPQDCDIEAIYGVTTGCGYRIRAFTVFRKRQPDLFS